MLIVLGRVYEGAMERTGQFEVIHCLVSRLLLSPSHVTEGITISMQYAEGRVWRLRTASHKHLE